jgi:ribosomal protein S6
MTDASQDGKVYEIGYLIVPTVSPDHISKEIDALKATINAAGASIIADENPKMRQLTYSMVKAVGQKRNTFDTAYFGWVKFEGSSDAMKAIEKAFAESEKVLRHLLIKTVRENTIYGPRILKEQVRGDSKDSVEVVPEKKGEASSEEIDKAVEKLITE